MNGRKLIDWRFVAMFVVMMLAVTLCWGFIRRVQQGDDLVRIADRSAQVAERQADEIADLRRTNATRSAQASRERDIQLAQIKRLQRQVTTLLKFLRENGLSVPSEATAPSTGSGENRPKAHHRRPTSPGTPTPTAPGPGNPSPSPNMACQLVPALCPFLSLPTLPRRTP